jgi:hypothetical protein
MLNFPRTAARKTGGEDPQIPLPAGVSVLKLADGQPGCKTIRETRSIPEQSLTEHP